MTEETEKWMDKVLKLLAKMESTTPEEAELLSAKAQEIMTRHAIDEAMLAAAKGELAPDEIIERTISFTGIYATSHQALMFGIGRGSDFRLLQGGQGNDRNGTWVGFESEIKVAEMLLTSLLLQAESAQRTFMKSWNSEHSWASAFEKATARRSFLNGFASGVQEHLVSARRAAEKEAAKDYAATTPEPTTDASGTPSTTSVALVLAGRQDRINDWMDKRYGKLKAGRSTRRRADFNAAGAGRTAGKNANFGGGKGVGGGTKGALGR